MPAPISWSIRSAKNGVSADPVSQTQASATKSSFSVPVKSVHTFAPATWAKDGDHAGMAPMASLMSLTVLPVKLQKGVNVSLSFKWDAFHPLGVSPNQENGDVSSGSESATAARRTDARLPALPRHS